VQHVLTQRYRIDHCACAFKQLVALCTLLSAHDVQLIYTALTALETVLSKEHTAGFDTFSRSSSIGSNSSSSSRGSWDASDRNPYALLIAEVGGLDQVTQHDRLLFMKYPLCTSGGWRTLVYAYLAIQLMPVLGFE
jgi:hypothetical protein